MNSANVDNQVQKKSGGSINIAQKTKTNTSSDINVLVPKRGERSYQVIGGVVHEDGRKVSLFDETSKEKMSKEIEPAVYNELPKVAIKN